MNNKINVLKVADNSKRKREDFNCIQNLVDHIADKKLEELGQEGAFVFSNGLSEIEGWSLELDEEQVILKSEKENYVTGNIMGILGMDHEQLMITSRFCKEENQDYFLQYLLQKVLHLPNFVSFAQSIHQEEKIFEWLTFLFPLYLQKALRKGKFRDYMDQVHNNAHVRGRMDIASHIQKNIPFQGKIAYRQREHLVDNDLMELIRHAIEAIRGKKYGHPILDGVKEEVMVIERVTLKYRMADRRKVIEANRKNPIQHAYYREYGDLQKLCLFILQNQQHSLYLGNQKMYGILFDGAWLWEEYLNLILGEKFYHPMNKKKLGVQKFFDRAGTIYPDFLGRNPINRVIADAKYKPAKNIYGRDYLQILAYMFRFESKRGYFLYPQSGEQRDGQFIHLRLNQGITYEKNVSPREDIDVIKLGFVIPRYSNNYKEFVRQMEESERLFFQLLASDNETNS